MNYYLRTKIKVGVLQKEVKIIFKGKGMRDLFSILLLSFLLQCFLKNGPLVLRLAAIAESVAVTPIQTSSFWLQRARKEAPAVQRVQRESLYYFLFLFSLSFDMRVDPS